MNSTQNSTQKFDGVTPGIAGFYWTSVGLVIALLVWLVWEVTR